MPAPINLPYDGGRDSDAEYFYVNVWVAPLLECAANKNFTLERLSREEEGRSKMRVRLSNLLLSPRRINLMSRFFTLEVKTPIPSA